MSDSYSSEHPPKNSELEGAIGRVIISWSVLERQISDSIEELFRLDSEMAGCITANLGTKAKLDIFQSAACYMDDYLKPAVTLARINDLVNDTAALSDRCRNFVAHGGPQEFDLGLEQNVWLWMRMSARKGGLKMRLTALKFEVFEKAHDDILALTERWASLRRDMESGLKFYDLCKLG